MGPELKPRNIPGKPKNPSILISSETAERLEVDCRVGEEEDVSALTLTLYIDGSAVATSKHSSRVRGILFKHYLQYRDSFLAECYLSLNHINYTASAQHSFPANYSSPVAKPLTSEASSKPSVFLLLIVVLLCQSI